MRYGS